MYAYDTMVLHLAREEIAKWPDNVETRKRIFIHLTVGIPGLDTVEQLNSAARIVGKIPATDVEIITLTEIRKMGYEF